LIADGERRIMSSIPRETRVWRADLGKTAACVAVPPAVCRQRAAVLSVRPPLPWSGATRPVAQINSR